MYLAGAKSSALFCNVDKMMAYCPWLDANVIWFMFILGCYAALLSLNVVQEPKVVWAVRERRKRKNPCPHSEDSNTTQKTQDTWIKFKFNILFHKTENIASNSIMYFLCSLGILTLKMSK